MPGNLLGTEGSAQNKRYRNTDFMEIILQWVKTSNKQNMSIIKLTGKDKGYIKNKMVKHKEVFMQGLLGEINLNL